MKARSQVGRISNTQLHPLPVEFSPLLDEANGWRVLLTEGMDGKERGEGNQECQSLDEPIRGKEAEQSLGRGEEEGRGGERIILRCWGSSGRHELIPQRLGVVALGSGLEMRSRSPVASLF